MATSSVEEASTRDEMAAIATCIWAVMSDTESAFHMVFPPLDSAEACLANCKELVWESHRGNPNSHWIYVRDPDSPTLRVLGACQWRIYDSTPFPPGIIEADDTAWPDGEGRLFAASFRKQCLQPRVKNMNRPHGGLSWCVVLPELQGKGIGRALMAWGIERIDKQGLEGYVEATAHGRHLYEKYDFRTVSRVDINMDMLEKSETIQEMEARYLPCGYDGMWRPVKGIWDHPTELNSWKIRMEEVNKA